MSAILSRTLPLAAACLFVMHVSGPYGAAQSPSPKPRQLGEFIKKLPKEEVGKLRGSRPEAVAKDLGQKMTQAEGGRDGTFRLEIENAWRDAKGNGWRLKTNDSPVKHGGVDFRVVAWIHVPQDPEGLLEKARPGQGLTVNGKVRIVEIKMNGPFLIVTMDATSVKR